MIAEGSLNYTKLSDLHVICGVLELVDHYVVSEGVLDIAVFGFFFVIRIFSLTGSDFIHFIGDIGKQSRLLIVIHVRGLVQYMAHAYEIGKEVSKCFIFGNTLINNGIVISVDGLKQDIIEIPILSEIFVNIIVSYGNGSVIREIILHQRYTLIAVKILLEHIVIGSVLGQFYCKELLAACRLDIICEKIVYLFFNILIAQGYIVLLAKRHCNKHITEIYIDIVGPGNIVFFVVILVPELRSIGDINRIIVVIILHYGFLLDGEMKRIHGAVKSVSLVGSYHSAARTGAQRKQHCGAKNRTHYLF